MAMVISGQAVMIIAIIIVLVSLLVVFYYCSFSVSSTEIKKNEKNFASESKNFASETEEEEKEIILIIVERIEYFSTEISESEYPSDYEEDLFMDDIHYPFKDTKNVKFVNGFHTETPNINWSVGKVRSIEKDANGEILWVWAEIHLYYPSAKPCPNCVLRCILSPDLKAHPISEGDFVLLKYPRRGCEEAFKNRTFTIIEIEKGKN